jgi:ABC-type sugar transport system substrate-binding protein
LANYDFKLWSTPPTKIPVSAPEKAPPKKESIAYITCGVPTCTYIADAVHQAANVLGWKYQTIVAQPTPTSIAAAWQTATRLHLNGVFASGFPRSIFESSLQTLHQQGVGVFECCAPDPPGDGLTMSISGPPKNSQAVQGDREAALDVHSIKGTPDILYVDLPEFATMAAELTRYQLLMHKMSPQSQVHVIDVANADIGVTSQDTIVSYLRANPGINFIQLTQDALSAGLPAAMSAAGLHVPFAGAGGGPAPDAMIAAGQQVGTITYPFYEIFWTLVDGMGRWLNHESLQPDQISTPFYITYKGNVNSTPSTITVKLKAQYAKLWGR